MGKYQKQRLIFYGLSALSLAVALLIIFQVFKDNIVFFYSPTDIAEKGVEETKFIRVGGLVKEGTFKRKNELEINFSLTDMTSDVKVYYSGIMPPMFREGQGIVAEGNLKGDVFNAKRLLTKHDENYMPPEVAESLKKSGLWKPEGEEK